MPEGDKPEKPEKNTFDKAVDKVMGKETADKIREDRANQEKIQKDMPEGKPSPSPGQ